MIAKRVKLPKPLGENNEFIYSDRSILYRRTEPAIVERVIRTRNENDVEIIKVKLRSDRPIRVGDKLCMTPDHDVLCSDGWKSIKDITLKDKVATYGQNGDLIYTNPTKVYEYDVDEQVYEIKNQQISLKVTKNHKMFIKKRNKSYYELCEAQDIFGKRVQYKKNVENNQKDIDNIVLKHNESNYQTFKMDDWLEFLGIFISDGCLVKSTYESKDYKLIIGAKKQRKKDNLTRICNNLGIHLSTCNESNHSYSIYSKNIFMEIYNHVGLGAENKKLPEYTLNLSKRQSRVLMEALISGDGTKYNGGNSFAYYTSSIKLRDDIMQLALHCGWSGNYSIHIKKGDTATITKNGVDRVITANFDNYRIAIINSKNEPMVNHGHVNQQNIQSEKYIDYKGKVHCIEVPNHVFYVRRDGKTCWTGNSSFSGCKGICAYKPNQSDMPYTEDGLKPDIIVNPHSIPTRMVIGQIIEQVMSELASLKGALFDGTAFKNLDIKGIIEELSSKYGIEYGGQRRMFNGCTGNWFDTFIFIAPASYQRLQKFVVDESYAMSNGPTDALTKQPLDGKSISGGLRFGEMEKDVAISHGIMNTLFQKFHDDSDGIEMHICRRCGNKMAVNEKNGILKCNICKENADPTKIYSSHIANLIFSTFESMGVKTRFHVEPMSYPTFE